MAQVNKAAEVKAEDLRSAPWHYQSSRPLSDVLIGHDTALRLLEASSTGDVKTLRKILQDSPSIALECPHRIYMEDGPAQDPDHVRRVHARKVSNVNRAILQAAENGHVEAVSLLLEFASLNTLSPTAVIDRETIKTVLQNGHAAIFDMLASADPSVVSHHDIHPTQRPLDFAIKCANSELVKIILQHGGGRESELLGLPRWSYSSLPYQGRDSRLCEAARRSTNMTQLLIEHGGYPVHGSGALQAAARSGALDTIRFLVEKHGADVNEVLPAETLHVARPDVALYASWTPMHFAASLGKEDAMKLLEGYGAKVDVRDVNGKTPLQVMEEWREKFGAK